MGGPAKRVWPLDLRNIKKVPGLTPTQVFDAAVADAARIYGKRMHNLISDNCHSHVALALNQLQYNGKKEWNQFSVFTSIWCHGSWLTKKDCFIVFAPFILFLVAILALCCFFAFSS